MGMFRHLLGLDGADDLPRLLPAIERSVTAVEPLLKQAGGYPNHYRKSIANALDYSHSLALSIPGPVAVDGESYAKDPFVHAIFPSMGFISDAFRASRSLQEYLQKFPANTEIYALMGMRRWEKNIMGMELYGEVIRRDVPQDVVYFNSHTIENPATSEQQARDQIAWSFFDRLVGKVAARVKARKQEKQTQLQEMSRLNEKLRTADAGTRQSLEAELSRLLGSIQSNASSLEFDSYVEDFEAVLLNPEAHLRLNAVDMVLDSMGIKSRDASSTEVQPVVFNDLIGFDRRNWTVTMVHCRDIPRETFAARLEDASRILSLY